MPTADSGPRRDGISAPPAGSGTYAPPDTATTPAAPVPPRRRLKIFRWRGIFPILVGLALAGIAWMLFSEPVVRDTMAEAATKSLGTQVDIARVNIREVEGALELHGLAIADPFDHNRNLFEAKLVRLELETEPLLEKKIVVRRLTIGDVRTGTRRATPARAIAGGGFAPRALREMDRWAKQFDIPLLSLTPIDTIKALILDPTQLRTVQAALAIARRADSVKGAAESGYAGLRLQETLDSTEALVKRLQATNVRTLGVDGVRGAIGDVRRATARVDSARRRVETLAATARAGIDSLQAGLRTLDAVRRDDYAFARGLLKLPSIDAPNIGASLFGNVTIDKFQQALYWTTLAREYAPPGLLPRESPGPQRMRLAGSTVHFTKKLATPRFLLRRGDVSLTVTDGAARGAYLLAVADATSEPTLLGRPTRFALRRTASGSTVESVLVTGLLDHVSARPRDVLSIEAAGVELPSFPLPGLPYRAVPGRGTSQLQLTVDGDQMKARWVIASGEVTWPGDAAAVARLNVIQSLVARVITGVRQLDVTAALEGPVRAPTLSVHSNLDRAVADRLRAVAGEEIAVAEAKVRAQVDRIVEERSAPLRARVAELRAEADRRVLDARTRLDDEKRKLDAQLKALSGGLVGLPKLPGLD